MIKTGTVGESDSKESGQISSSKAHRDDNVQLKGRNTFAVPRNVRPLGWIDKNKKTEEEKTDETPKSNDEFRKMLLKG